MTVVDVVGSMVTSDAPVTRDRAVLVGRVIVKMQKEC